jgi:predicted TIM-barrel fold metal-dependent hydrolase
MFPPALSCDCHVHVIGPKSRFPLPRERRYTPMDAPAEALQAMLKRLRLDRVVLVQPSFYATDNSCMLDAMRRIPNSRGVAVLPPDVPESELAALHAQGVRGLRVNIATFGTRNLNEMREGVRAAAQLCEMQGWHMQIFIPSDAIEPLAPLLLALPVPTVIDHFGLIAPGAEDNALRMLLELLHTGKIWVKISGAYRIAHRRPRPAALRGQPRTHRLGLRLATHAEAHHSQRRQRRGTAIPAGRYRGPARTRAALARRRHPRTPRVGR